MSLTHAKGNGGTYPYFFCIGRTRRNGCQQSYIPTDMIERAVERTLRPPRTTRRTPRDHPLKARPRTRWDAHPGRTGDSPPATPARQAHRRAHEAPTRLLPERDPPRPPPPGAGAHRTQTASAEAQLSTAHRSATDVQATLQKALDLLAACHDAYTNAPGHLRRQWNQALFLRLHVHDQDIQHAEIAEPFATLTTPSLPDELDNPSTSHANAAQANTTPPLSTATVQIRIK